MTDQQNSSHKIILFDIDYTLFDTDAYRRILYPRLAQKLGLNVEELRIFRKEFEPEMKAKFGHFNPEFFLKKILSITKQPSTLESLEEIFWDKDIYLSVLDTKSKEVFEQLRKHTIEIGLLSTGDRQHQLTKIAPLLSYLPENNQHIFSNKIDSLKDVLEIYTSFKVYIIDDLEEVLAKAKEINPDVVTILKKTQKIFEKTDHVDDFKSDFEIDDISEVPKIVLDN